MHVYNFRISYNTKSVGIVLIRNNILGAYKLLKIKTISIYVIIKIIYNIKIELKLIVLKYL